MIHGTKKSKVVKTQQEIAAENALAARVSKELKEFFELRKNEKTDLVFLNQFTEILMELCPDVATIYNYRRQLILEQLKKAQTVEAQAGTLQSNLKLTTKLLKGDPKSYNIWSFRQWLVTTIFNLTKSTDVLKMELQLCRMMLEKDEKNFHVWNYRNWLNDINVELEKAIKFCHEKISKNPFNFSPYHFLTKHYTQKYWKLIQENHSTQILQYSMDKSVFDQELESVMTAIAMGPQEQAAWNYYKWLIKRTLPCRVIKINKIEGGYEIILNYKAYNFSSHIKLQGQWTLKSSTASEPSSQWILLTKSEATVEVQSNYSSKEYIRTELGLSFLGTQDNPSVVSECRRIIQEQIEYIEEQVYAAEQYKCRYAAITILQMFRLLLHLNLNKQQWQKILDRANVILVRLREEKKGHKYIQKLSSIWAGLSAGGEQLSLEQRCLLP